MGVSFLRFDGTVWATDKDGPIMDLLAAEITARTDRAWGQHYRELTAELGARRITRGSCSTTQARVSGSTTSRRDLLDSGTLKSYINELSVIGLTSNPTIFDHAMKNGPAYDTSTTEKLSVGKSSDALFFDLALEDPSRAAALTEKMEARNGLRASKAHSRWFMTPSAGARSNQRQCNCHNWKLLYRDAWSLTRTYLDVRPPEGGIV